jgi:hypothetical protein
LGDDMNADVTPKRFWDIGWVVAASLSLGLVAAFVLVALSPRVQKNTSLLVQY